VPPRVSGQGGTWTAGPQGIDVAHLGDAFTRAAIDADSSLKDTFERAGIHPGVTIQVNGQTVYTGQDVPLNFNYQSGFASPPPFDISAEPAERPTFASLRSRLGLDGPGDVFGAIAAAMGVPIAIGLGGSAALTAVVPASALWTSRIICGAPHQMIVNTSHYSYKPSQSGTSVNFQCLTAAGGQDANWLAIMALQGLLLTVMLASALAVDLLISV
jgi:hypothetical protein